MDGPRHMPCRLTWKLGLVSRRSGSCSVVFSFTFASWSRPACRSTTETTSADFFWSAIVAHREINGRRAEVDGRLEREEPRPLSERAEWVKTHGTRAARLDRRPGRRGKKMGPPVARFSRACQQPASTPNTTAAHFPPSAPALTSCSGSPAARAIVGAHGAPFRTARGAAGSTFRLDQSSALIASPFQTANSSKNHTAKGDHPGSTTEVYHYKVAAGIFPHLSSALPGGISASPLPGPADTKRDGSVGKEAFCLLQPFSLSGRSASTRYEAV
jgi:hypothetical protein